MPHDVNTFGINHFYELIDSMKFFIVLFYSICHDIHTRNAVAAAGDAMHLCSFDPNRMELVDYSFFFQLIKALKMVKHTGLAIYEIVHDIVISSALLAQIRFLSKRDVDGSTYHINA